jgi:hypothetical protein
MPFRSKADAAAITWKSPLFFCGPRLAAETASNFPRKPFRKYVSLLVALRLGIKVETMTGHAGSAVVAEATRTASAVAVCRKEAIGMPARH